MNRVAVLVVSVVLLSAVTAPAVAQEDESLLDSIVSDDSFVDRVVSFAGGLVDRVGYAINPGDKTASESADALQSTYNEHSDEFERYANERSTAAESLDVVRIDLVVDGETETVYAIGTVNGSDYENTSIVESTDRDPDEWISLCGPVARNAGEELETFYDQFVSQNETVTESYYYEVAGRYGGNAKSSLLDHTEDCDG